MDLVHGASSAKRLSCAVTATLDTSGDAAPFDMRKDALHDASCATQASLTFTVVSPVPAPAVWGCVER